MQPKVCVRNIIGNFFETGELRNKNMLDYETAKRLDDAGFPQKLRGSHVSPVNEVLDFPLSNTVYVPPLDELIEECGERFYVLVYDYSLKTWFAEAWEDVANRDFVEGRRIKSGGDTPTKAVSELWMKMNKKDE